MTSPPSSSLASQRPAIGFFERYLTIWVALCMLAGVALGQLLPGLAKAIATLLRSGR
jgi:ACR3 family arsenite transporter